MSAASYATRRAAPPVQPGKSRPSAPSKCERRQAECSGCHVLEVRHRERGVERSETEYDQRDTTEARRKPFGDPADEENAEQEREPAREHARQPEPEALDRPVLDVLHGRERGSRKLERRHSRRLVRVEMPAVRRLVGRPVRAQAGVGGKPEIQERSRETETRDVLRVDGIDRREGGQRNERQQQQLEARAPPR